MGCPRCGYSHPPDGMCLEPIEEKPMAAAAKLDEATRERLEMLAEEAAEVIQACQKILRHGLHSYHPDDPKRVNNSRLLEEELMELWTVYEQCVLGGELRRINFYGTQDVWKKKLKWTHHQRGSSNAED